MKKRIIALAMGLLLIFSSCGTSKNEQVKNNEKTTEEISKETEKENINFEDTDVLVIGAGLSGAATAIEALENGLSVTIIDKAPVFGSGFLPSKGNFMNAMVDENKDSHIKESSDTLDAAIDRWKSLSEIGNNEDWEDVDYDRVKTMLIESANSIKWIEDMGVAMEPSFDFNQRGQDVAKVVKQGDESEGKTLMAALEKKAKDLGAKIYYQTKATDLIVEEGKVVGAVVEKDSNKAEIRAKNVVLAMGGFAASEEFIKEKIPNLYTLGYNFFGNPMNEGEAFKFADQVNAKTYDHNWIVPSPFGIKPKKELLQKDDIFKRINMFSDIEENFIQKRMIVGKDLKRFVNEASNPSGIIASMIDYKSDGTYLVLDETNTELNDVLEKNVDDVNIIKVDKNSDDFDKLKETIDSYNNNGEDEFGKANIEDKENFIHKYEGDTFYLVSMEPEIVATMGGLVTDKNCQVINKENEKIEGLYAVGEITHKFLYNRTQFANASNSASVSMGRLLGKYLANK